MNDEGGNISWLDPLCVRRQCEVKRADPCRSKNVPLRHIPWRTFTFSASAKAWRSCPSAAPAASAAF